MKVGKSLNIDTTVPVELENHTLTLYSASRWTALIRGIDVIDKKAKQLKIDLAGSGKWVKPLALQKYIDEETNHMVTAIKTLMDEDE